MNKILIVGTNNSYTNELKRVAAGMNMEVCAVCSSIEEVREFFETGEVADIVIASDNLFVGTTVPQVLSELMNAGYYSNLFFVLKHDTYVEYLLNNQIAYTFENDTAPMNLLQMIGEALGIPTASMNEYDARGSRQNMSDRYGQEQTNRDRYPQQNGYRQDNYRQNSMNQGQMRQGQMNGQSQFNGGPNRGNMNHNSSRPQNGPMGYNQRGFRPMMIAINSPKGGVGKTSLSIELSSMLAARAKEIDFNPSSRLHSGRQVEVCLVDLNPSFDTMASSLSFVRNCPNYPTVSEWVNAIEEKIYNYLTPAEKKAIMNDRSHDFGPYIREDEIFFSRDEIRKLLIQDQKTGLYVLPSVSLPFDVEYVKPQYLRIMLNQIRKVFDVVIVDTGNNISFFTVEALKAADEVFLLTTPTIGSTTVLGKLTKNTNRLRLSSDKINLVVNYPNGAESDLSPAKIAEALRLPLVSVLPFEEGIRNSHEKGEPFAIYNRKSEYTREIIKLAQQICPLWSTTTQKSPKASTKKKKKKKGLFSFLMS